ncbi:MULTISPECIES: thioesterase family protein [unclassified Arthrobacter]|uniref:thioesterase family protein n=1 Tax=unclassified Arthrobacter TaxID=235627 RepID=UPI001D13EB0E|nr:MULTISPECIES: thioesterase family protein [unclassified Arthrobacter]MCC3275213.1 thioesterase family protein [Arthrobacter sp. zg-Y20]MCC3278291.1 thioesterase family protein [Arthrobacter sp. zg-Y40]MCC9176659.1 thioesterase family protein [Arthrobacter sp. zg-Y750]MDK1315370.1 thioesterase family protein [Arthrobacter sp. zg.Y20]MDK1326637.1 thioesterase family protein [Arthrobacter sp. zg-Y1143]
MHLILRTLLILFRARRRSKLGFFDNSSVPMRVLPTDIDVAMHLNNGMYLSLMDLGRFDLLVRSGMWDIMKKNKWSPVVNNETISFRKSLQLNQQYSIETKIIGFDDRAIYLEQRMVADGEIYASAVIGARFLSAKGPLSNEEIFKKVGAVPPSDLVLPEWISEWRASVALPSTRRPAPHIW